MDAEKAGQVEPKDQRGRRPYERPAIGWEEDFEPYVYASCMKAPGQSAACNVGGGKS